MSVSSHPGVDGSPFRNAKMSLHLLGENRTAPGICPLHFCFYGHCKSKRNTFEGNQRTSLHSCKSSTPGIVCSEIVPSHRITLSCLHDVFVCYLEMMVSKSFSRVIDLCLGECHPCHCHSVSGWPGVGLYTLLQGHACPVWTYQESRVHRVNGSRAILAVTSQ